MGETRDATVAGVVGDSDVVRMAAVAVVVLVVLGRVCGGHGAVASGGVFRRRGKSVRNRRESTG